MIPKIIHYCWFGRSEKPKLAIKCINSWKKFCGDYQIIEWNEDNFDISSNCYTKEAYEYKKYAFITDYVRLYVMVNYGGIYMDTDVEVIKSLDDYLEHQAFSGFELPNFIPTGIMASEKDYPLFKELLHYYNDKHFVNENGELNTTTNVQVITGIVEKYGLIKDGSFQVINGLALYPMDYFCPLNDATGKLTKTINTSTIHWFNKSWLDPKIRFRSKITKLFHRMFGKECFYILKKLIKK